MCTMLIQQHSITLYEWPAVHLATTPYAKVMSAILAQF